MKLKFLLISLLTLLCFGGFTQNKPFRFGVRAAPNISWISPESKDYNNEGTKLGFSWGFIADVTLSDNYFIKTGFSMDYLNGSLSYPHQMMLDDAISVPTQGTLYRNYHLRYLEIPISLKMRTNQFGKTAIFGEVGFGTSFNLKARSEDEFVPDDGGSPIESDNDIKDDIALVKGSLIIGGGIEYFIDKSTSLVFSLSFNNGLTNILSGNNDVDPSTKERANLHYFQLNLGILF